MGLPGVKVGPLDPDKTSGFGMVNAQTSARKLIRLHAQMHPQALVHALVLKFDAERTKAVQERMGEVREYLSGLTHANGDPVVPEGAVVEGASVGGERDTDQVLRFTYRLRSGRSAKWFVPYDPDALPEAHELGSDYIRRQEMQERGVVAWDSEGHETDRLRREASRLRRQNEALRSSLEGQAAVAAGEVPEVEGDSRPDATIVEENQQLRREIVEIREQLGRLNALAGHQQADTAESAGEATSAQEPPFAGYDDLKADEIVKRLHDPDTNDEERQSILDYEAAHANRKTVVGAAETSLGARGSAG